MAHTRPVPRRSRSRGFDRCSICIVGAIRGRDCGVRRWRLSRRTATVLGRGGVPFAQAMIGHIYGEGLGVPRDQARSIYWYRLAADQGHAIAQYNLGVIHEKGLGVSRDYVAAVFWYRLAVEQDRALAQSNLGLMYLNGQGVRTDFVQRFAWNSIAAGQGDAYAESIENQLVT